MGLTECGNYTAGIKAIAGLFPGASRSTAGGVFNAGAQLGSVIAPLFVLALLRERLGLSVPMAFIVPTALGLVWLLPWLAIFPRQGSDGGRLGEACRRRHDRGRPGGHARRSSFGTARCSGCS